MRAAEWQVLWGGGRYNSALTHFLALGNSARTIYFAGDSTTANFTSLFTEFSGFSTKTGELFQGATCLNRGNVGASTAAFLADGVTYGISDLISTAPQLVVFRYGINDVRTGASTTAQLIALYKQAITRIRAALPSTDILFIIPNSLLSTDPTSSGYVTTTGLYSGMTLAQAAQTATDIMWNAGQAIRGLYPNVVVLDLQTQVYGRTCQATSALMFDILHPINTATHAGLIASLHTSVAGYRAPFDSVASAAAWASNPSNPWTVYSRAIEDPSHKTPIILGTGNSQVAKSGSVSSVSLNGGFIDFRCDDATLVHKLDYLEQAWGGGTWQIPNGSTIAQQSGSVTRIFGLGGALPTFAQSGGSISVYR